VPLPTLGFAPFCGRASNVLSSSPHRRTTGCASQTSAAYRRRPAWHRRQTQGGRVLSWEPVDLQVVARSASQPSDLRSPSSQSGCCGAQQQSQVEHSLTAHVAHPGSCLETCVRQIAATVLILALASGIALAQTGSGAPSGGASSGGAPSGGAPPSAAPAAPGATPVPSTGPAANPALVPAPRTNTEVFPPSRNLQLPAPRATSPGGLSQPGATNPSAGAATPGAPQPRTSQPNASGGTRAQPGGASSSAQSRENRTGKNPVRDEYADCLRLWDRGTHMSKKEWSATCHRIQSRLDQVQVK
jgi:hypothetical protein